MAFHERLTQTFNIEGRGWDVHWKFHPKNCVLHVIFSFVLINRKFNILLVWYTYSERRM